MSKLVVNPGTSGAWEINLKPGANFLGRADTNDFKINDPSVSGSHCQIVVSDQRIVLTDSGSTNGTFVGGTPIREKQLEHGHAIRLGGVEMIFYSDTGAMAAPIAVPVAVPVAIAVAPAVPKPGAPPALRVSALGKAPVATAAPAVEQAASSALPPQMLSGTRYCKFHPQGPAHHLCPKCNLTYCDLCISISEVGDNTLRTCRKCGTEVLPFQFRAAVAKSFSKKLPGAFVFPFRGAGIVILLCATIAFAALNFIGGGIFGILIKAALTGFVFLFMQNIILTTTSDEKDDLNFPDPGGLYGAAGQLVGTVIASFWLTIALEVARIEDVEIPTEAIVASVILGGIYFPMALLAVAMKDTVMAANPLVVIPAMLKAPGKYAITVALTLAVFGIRQLGIMWSGDQGHKALMARHVNDFMVAAGIQMVLAVVSVYLLTVMMRILGLFYNSSKQKLGWYNH